MYMIITEILLQLRKRIKAETQTTTYVYDALNYADGLRYLKSTGSSHTQVNYDYNAEVLTEEKSNGNSIVQQSTFVRGTGYS
ncbi:hypothetical protein ACDZ28_15950 [Paenibacillus sp. RS8]|uniref:hypothetical protein n=1 Tax=Paenibacillus sp. RS8 TaxID=3242681 RepID=UPI0035BF750E